MIPVPTSKPKRGGQPGNHNARGNRGGAPRGNKNALGNRGGAPRGNRNACKKLKAPHLILLEDYEHCPEAAAWIEAHADALDEAIFTDDDHRDRALFAVYLGQTVEAIIRNGKEYEHGLYALIEIDFDEQTKRAA